MNEDELMAIEIRAAEATAGPWKLSIHDRANRGKTTVIGGTPGGRIDVAIIQPWIGHEEENAWFIANAREDVPALIAEIRRLQKTEQKLRKQLEIADAVGAAVTRYQANTNQHNNIWWNEVGPAAAEWRKMKSDSEKQAV